LNDFSSMLLSLGHSLASSCLSMITSFIIKFYTWVFLNSFLFLLYIANIFPYLPKCVSCASFNFLLIHTGNSTADGYAVTCFLFSSGCGLCVSDAFKERG
jgi:hypothetical protein